MSNIICSDWITTTELVACGCPPDASSTIIGSSITAASEILYQLTGRQYPGVCTQQVRPCAAPASWSTLGWSATPFIPILISGAWYNMGPCGCHQASDCGCGPYPRVDLGRDDVTAVTAVTIDGTVLSPAAYRVDEQRFLVRQDGSGWPCCQNMASPPGDPGTWTVTYDYGRTPTASLAEAAASLATEFVKGCIGDDTCRIPNRATTVTREGITYALIDPQEFITAGLTGLYEVDLAVKAANPNGVMRRARIVSPEQARTKRVG